MLTIKLELEKNKENYQAVMEALAEFDIVSASWDTGEPAPKEMRSGRSGGDLSSAISMAVDSFAKRPR